MLLRDIKKYLINNNNLQRVGYKRRLALIVNKIIFKPIIIRIRKIIIAIIKDYTLSITISSIYILNIFQSILKIIIDIDLRNLIYFNYKKIDYIKRDYLVQRQININKKALRKIRIYKFIINNEYKINLLVNAYEAFKNLRNNQSLLKLR